MTAKSKQFDGHWSSHVRELERESKRKRIGESAPVMSPCSDVLQGHPWLLAIFHILCSLSQTPSPGTLGTAGGHGFGHIVT